MGEKTVACFEDALRKTGFGLYSYVLISAIGVNTIAYICILFNTTIIVPASACELQTTVAQRGMLAAGPFVGLILGGGLWGVLADVFGRRRTLLISILSSALVNAIASISANWVMLLCLQFITALLASGQYSQAMSMLSESVPLAKRNMVVLIVNSLSLLSQGIMAVLAIPIIPLTFSYYIPILNIYWNSWRTLLIVYSLPSLLSAVLVYTLEESPKFAYSRGREKESLEILGKIYKLNNRDSLKKFEVNEIVKTTDQNGPKNVKEQILPLFKLPLLRYTVILTLLCVFQQVGSFLIWLPTIANQFIEIMKTGERTDLTLCGVLNTSRRWQPDTAVAPCSLNITAMLILLAMGLLHSLLNLFVSLVVDKVGRRNVMIIITSVCGLSGIAVNLVPNVAASSLLFLIFLIGIIVLGLYVATAVALFPTYLRVFAVSFMMTGGRITNFATLQIVNYLLENNCDVAFYTFSTIFASSAMLALFLADDRKSSKNSTSEDSNENADI